jgi:hypothetical protein
MRLIRTLLAMSLTTATAALVAPAPASRRGGIARLRYRVYDDSGVTSEYLQVYRSHRLLAAGHTEFGPAQGAIYWVGWRVPRLVKGAVKFCVRSSDESGNTSARSCAPVKIG